MSVNIQIGSFSFTSSRKLLSSLSEYFESLCSTDEKELIIPIPKGVSQESVEKFWNFLLYEDEFPSIDDFSLLDRYFGIKWWSDRLFISYLRHDIKKYGREKEVEKKRIPLSGSIQYIERGTIPVQLYIKLQGRSLTYDNIADIGKLISAYKQIVSDIDRSVNTSAGFYYEVPGYVAVYRYGQLQRDTVAFLRDNLTFCSGHLSLFPEMEKVFDDWSQFRPTMDHLNLWNPMYR